MIIERLAVGLLEANCYILGCPETRACAIIDPGGDAERITSLVADMSLHVTSVIATHGHCDHIAAVRDIKERFPEALLAIHEADAHCLGNANLNLSAALGMPFTLPAAEQLLQDGDEIEVGVLRLRVIHVPGHTPGGIALYVVAQQDPAGKPAVFCGDTLFAGSIGRADLPGGDMEQLLASIRKRLLTLPPETVCYPGHGEPTTIGREARCNPFLNE